MTANPSSILITVLDNLGDTVMATAVLAPLKKAYPGTRIGMFVKRYAEGVLAHHSMIDRLHAADPFWDNSPGQPPGSFLSFVGAVNDIRRTGYDAVLVLNSEWRRALAMVAARIPQRIGFNRRHAGPLLTTQVATLDESTHFIANHHRLADVLGKPLRDDDFIPRLETTATDSAWLEGWLRQMGWTDEPGYIAIHPFSGDERKNWPLESWTTLIDRLRNRVNARFLVLCSSSEREKLAAWHARQAADIRIIEGAPLHQVKALVSGARLLVGGDSGLGHVAAALGTPVVSLFGPGNPERSGPRGRGAIRVIRKDPLHLLPVANVEENVIDLLGAPVEQKNA